MAEKIDLGYIIGMNKTGRVALNKRRLKKKKLKEERQTREKTAKK